MSSAENRRTSTPRSSQPKGKQQSSDTRARILREAAHLFSHRGYDSVSTRDIAAACGIRQPSIYWFFPTKGAIMAELIEEDLAVVVPTIRWIGSAEATPAARLYRYLHTDMTHLVNDPYGVITIYDTGVLENEEFAAAHRKLLKVPKFFRKVIREGVASGQFDDQPIEWMVEYIVAISMHSNRLAVGTSTTRRAKVPEVFSSLALRGILADPSTLDDVRAEAMDLVEPPELTELLRGGAASQRTRSTT